MAEIPTREEFRKCLYRCMVSFAKAELTISVRKAKKLGNDAIVDSDALLAAYDAQAARIAELETALSSERKSVAFLRDGAVKLESRNAELEDALAIERTTAANRLTLMRAKDVRIAELVNTVLSKEA